MRVYSARVPIVPPDLITRSSSHCAYISFFASRAERAEKWEIEATTRYSFCVSLGYIARDFLKCPLASWSDFKSMYVYLYI